LAYRAGSASRGRVHIFWQRRVRAGDTETPWWFPAKTDSGAIREDRIVLPIPPGTGWREVEPLVLPDVARAPRPCLEDKRKRMGGAPMPRQTGIAAGGLRFAAPKVVETPKPREPRAKAKADPKLVAAARELRDRWLERVNAVEVVSGGKYDVGRSLPTPPQGVAPVLVSSTRRMLPAA
ncbi:MAG TPA: hypothetical protein VFB66_09400, partial [Tepidisphaeraceae bacterium]|nr:hypothetical protein [Tepidisphaeraceae bacterium]